MKPFSEWRRDYFTAYAHHHPEEATTLGFPGHAHRLSDISQNGQADRQAFFTRTLRELEAYHLSGQLTADEALDGGAISRIAQFSARAHLDRSFNVELSVFPYSMVAHQRVHAESTEEKSALCDRLAAIPLFLKQNESNAEEALRGGTRIDRGIVKSFVEEVLPGAIASLREMGGVGEEAAVAYEAHLAFLREEILPRAGEAFAVGEEGVQFRLECFLGTPTSIDELIAEASDALKVAQSELVSAAKRVAAKAGVSVASHKDAAAFFMALWAEHPASHEVAMAMYRSTQTRAEGFVRERGLFAIDGPFNMRIATIPKGIAVGTSATNWPAPLLRAEKSGSFLIAHHAEAHSIAGAANLAVHEGIPGHYLQSFVWQRAFSGEGAPVRFVCVTDDVAMARHYYGSMVNIEGFAAYAEELMLAEGFFSDEEALLSIVSKAIRAARVVCDLSLHSGRMSKEGAAHFLSEEAAMPRGWAEGQIARYARIPLQALTYHLGCAQIWALKKNAQRLPNFSQARFHAALLGVGPVPPRCAADVILARLTEGGANYARSNS